MRRSRAETVLCRSPEGRVVAFIDIASRRSADLASHSSDTLLVLSPEEAATLGEEPIQLLERKTYEYRVRSALGSITDLVMLEARGIRSTSLESIGEDRGVIETGDYCGFLPLTVVRKGDSLQKPIGHAAVEVRSHKINYRQEYRAMVEYVGERCAGLLLESRALTKLRLSTLWKGNRRILEQQLEFLRHTLESTRFATALREIVKNPHRRIEEISDYQTISRSARPDKRLAAEIASARKRIPVPTDNPLRKKFASLPAQRIVTFRQDSVDTPENRFAKLVLEDFRRFLNDVNASLSRAKPEAANLRLLRETKRLQVTVERHLKSDVFAAVSLPNFIPLRSPSMQRRAGYRELLQIWLQFHAAAQLAWDGGGDIFRAGARNTAILYEYWLFFQLENLFRRKFDCDEPLHTTIVDKSKVPPQLILKRGVELRSPIAGCWSHMSRRNLRAEFHFNRRFSGLGQPQQASSWTRSVRPDFTISVWPAEYSSAEAEKLEVIVHLHLDAKYRVDRLNEIVGDDEETLDGVPINKGVAHYEDLLKMHAYRDAIRRTAGAYVLYPGESSRRLFRGFHEILPGLGAFSVRPESNGRARGLAELSAFLDDVLEHLANRTTARERLTFHLEETYRVRDVDVISPVRLAETDLYGREYRALPPAEDHVLVAWYNNSDQLKLAESATGVLYVRLGRRAGSLHVHPNLCRVRHLLMRTHGAVAPGLLELREPGFRIFTRAQLRDELRLLGGADGVALWYHDVRPDDDEYIYALFRTRAAAGWSEMGWDADRVMELVESFESDRRNRPVVNVGRTSPYPRILPLRDVLKAAIRS